jgi:hypothetical protein
VQDIVKRGQEDLDISLKDALVQAQEVQLNALMSLDDGHVLRLLAPNLDPDPGKIASKLVLARPAESDVLRNRNMEYVMATTFIMRLMHSYAKKRNGVAQKNLCSFLARFSELRTAAGKLYEVACHLFLIGKNKDVRWYERRTSDYYINFGTAQQVPWAESECAIQLQELPSDSKKATEALAAYAIELPVDSAYYIRPLNPNQVAWDALIILKQTGSESDLDVFFLQMSYSNYYDINYKGLESVREALLGITAHFTYVLVLHPGDNQTLITRKKKINFHINEKTPGKTLRPLWESQTRNIRGGLTNRHPSLKSMREDLNGDKHDWARMEQYVIPVGANDIQWTG